MIPAGLITLLVTSAVWRLCAPPASGVVVTNRLVRTPQMRLCHRDSGERGCPLVEDVAVGRMAGGGAHNPIGRSLTRSLLTDAYRLTTHTFGSTGGSISAPRSRRMRRNNATRSAMRCLWFDRVPGMRLPCNELDVFCLE